MAKKSAIKGEYIIQVEESGSIMVYRVFDNVKASLREASNAVGFAYDSAWTTQQFGAHLVKQYGDGHMANVGDYVIIKNPSNKIETYRTYDNVKGALREVAESVGFSVDPDWTTRQLGNKLIDFINK